MNKVEIFGKKVSVAFLVATSAGLGITSAGAHIGLAVVTAEAVGNTISSLEQNEKPTPDAPAPVSADQPLLPAIDDMGSFQQSNVLAENFLLAYNANPSTHPDITYLFQSASSHTNFHRSRFGRLAGIITLSGMASDNSYGTFDVPVSCHLGYDDKSAVDCRFEKPRQTKWNLPRP